jgi:hypothetical protein
MAAMQRRAMVEWRMWAVSAVGRDYTTCLRDHGYIEGAGFCDLPTSRGRLPCSKCLYKERLILLRPPVHPVRARQP